MPRIRPEPRYFSMPSTDEGAEAFKNRTRNCRPCVRSLVHSPEAVIPSPAEIIAAWPTAVTSSRWPRALRRSTQKPVSGLWKVTRSTRPASTSRPGAAPRPPAWPAGVRSRWSADGFGPGCMGVDCHRRRSGLMSPPPPRRGLVGEREDGVRQTPPARLVVAELLKARISGGIEPTAYAFRSWRSACASRRRLSKWMRTR